MYKFFPGFELKFQVFQFLSKFQVFSRPGKVNDKIPGFPGSMVFQVAWIKKYILARLAVKKTHTPPPNMKWLVL